MTSIIKVDQIQTTAGTAPTAADLGLNISGNVLQVVEGEYNTQTDIASQSYTDSGLSVTITPKFSSSKVYVITNVHTFINGVGLIGVKIVRGSTSILETQGASGYADNSSDIVSMTKLDSPSTTSATTYKVQVNHNSASGTLRINQVGGSRITVMEIAQ